MNKENKFYRYLFHGKTKAEFVLYALIFLLFLLFALSYLYLLVWCLFAGLKTHDELVMNALALPENWLFVNFVNVFHLIKYNDTTFMGMVFYSIYFSIFGAFLSTMSTCMIAYAATKYKFPGSRALFYCSLVMIELPIYGSGGSQYKLLYNLGLINSPLMIITSVGGLGMYFMYFNAFFKGLSWTYAEAAQIDGANDFTVFFRVMFPQTRVLFGSLFLITMIGEWNNYGTAIIYLSKMPTLAAGLYLFKIQMEFNAQLNYYYAACFLALLPMLLIFVAFNNAIMSNVSLGGIKE